MKINLKNNTGLKILSLVIAIALWYTVGNIDDPVTIDTYTNIPVQIINGDVLKSNNKAYEITEGEMVSFTVRGKTSILAKLKESDFKAEADLEKLSLVNSVPIEVSVARYANDVDITLGRINTLKVNIENRVEAMLPVIVETEGTVGNGYTIGTKTSSPNMIEIAGSESMINRLKEIRVVVNVNNANQDIAARQSIKFYDQNGDVVESPMIDCDTKSVNVMIDLWKTKEIPVSLKTRGTPAAGYGISAFDYEPKTVVIAANDEMLDKVKELDVDDLNVHGANANVEQSIIVDSSALPQGVVFYDSSIAVVAKAVVELKVSGSVKLKPSDIRIDNLPSGKNVTFDKQEYEIEVSSYKSKLTNLEGSSFDPYINITELGNKTSGKIRIHLSNPDGVTVSNTLSAEITVN